MRRTRAGTPSTSGAVQTAFFVAPAVTINGWTTISWVNLSGANDGVTITLNGAGNAEIAGPGAYLIGIEALGFAVGPGVSADMSYDVRSIAGAAGEWTTNGTGLFPVTLLTVAGVAAALNAPTPAGLAMMWVLSGDTFPMELEAQARYTEDNVDTSTSVNCFMSITRWDVFE